MHTAHNWSEISDNTQTSPPNQLQRSQIKTSRLPVAVEAAWILFSLTQLDSLLWSSFPQRQQWDSILNQASDRRTCERGRFIQSILKAATTANTTFNAICHLCPAVLTRHFTCAELLAPGAPFIKKVLTVNLLWLSSDLYTWVLSL